jgi:hypothetical protein
MHSVEDCGIADEFIPSWSDFFVLAQDEGPRWQNNAPDEPNNNLG